MERSLRAKVFQRQCAGCFPGSRPLVIRHSAPVKMMMMHIVCMMLHGSIQQRSTARRSKRRSRSGDGVVAANRKTEICVHWQTGFCPYGAGSCAFAHGLGELRHPTLDDKAIAMHSATEDAECRSCFLDTPTTSSSERRLPTFVSLGSGTTSGGSNVDRESFSSPAASQPYDYAEDDQRSPHHHVGSWSPPPSAFSGSYGFAVAPHARLKPSECRGLSSPPSLCSSSEGGRDTPAPSFSVASFPPSSAPYENTGHSGSRGDIFGRGGGGGGFGDTEENGGTGTVDKGARVVYAATNPHPFRFP